MSYKKIINRIGLGLFKELPYLAINIPRPRVKDFKAVESLKDKNFHFHYVFGIPNNKQDFANTKFESIIAIEVKAKGINELSKHQN